MAISLSLGATSDMSLLLIEISPPLIFSKPAIQFNRVDFPHPEGPTKTRKSPLSILIFMSFKTEIFPKFLLTSFIFKIDDIILSLYRSCS